MKKLFLVDAYALIFKYYYAFLGRPMRNRAGMNTSVVFGFVKFLRDIQKRERPDLLGVAFDPKGGSFRRDIFPEYKATRSETPEDILLSIPYVKRVLDAMCIPILEVAGYEADDVIGTISQKGVEAGYDVYMVTPDKDYGQLVRDNCRIYKQRGAEGSIEIVDREALREKYGIDDPQLVRDILALSGDASDNIPGVPGIGEKIACKLVREWGTVENILENVGKIPGKQGEKIAEWGDKLRLAKTLTTICLDVPIPFREEDLTVCAPHIDELKALIAEKEFKANNPELFGRYPKFSKALAKVLDPSDEIKPAATEEQIGNQESVRDFTLPSQVREFFLLTAGINVSTSVIVELSGTFNLTIHGERYCVLGEFWKEADGDQLLLRPGEKTIWYYTHEQDKVKRLCNDMTELLEKKLARYLNEQ